MTDRKYIKSIILLLALTTCCINSGCITYMLTPPWTHDQWIAYYQRRIRENRRKLKHHYELNEKYRAEVAAEHGVHVDELTHDQLRNDLNYHGNEFTIRNLQHEITCLEDKIDLRHQAQNADRLAAVHGHRYRHKPTVTGPRPTHGSGHSPTVKPKPPTHHKCPHRR